MCDDPRCHIYDWADLDLSEFPALSGEAGETELPDGTPRLITARFEPPQTRYGSH